jgi:hypothetical protein
MALNERTLSDARKNSILLATGSMGIPLGIGCRPSRNVNQGVAYERVSIYS